MPFHTRHLFICLIAMLPIASCKKDKLPASQIQKLDSHTTDRLNVVKFIDGIGYIGGGQRFATTTMLTSNDGGNSWAVRNFPESGKAIYGIAAKYDQLGVFTIGFEGKILHSTDNGDNWQYIKLAQWEPYKDLAFIEPATCIAIGGVSFHNGRLTYLNDQYQAYRDDSLGYELNDIEMINNKTGYIAGFGVVLKTDDGAVNWHILDVKNDNFTALHANNANELWVCGYNGSIFRSTNGGQSWEKQRNGNSLANKKYHLLDIYFKDSNNGWAVGEDGLVIRTTNGGADWEAYEKVTGDALRSIAPTPDGNLILCGDNGALYRLLIN
jgi:photosystem II stability/assembly factor-like uncharacterized protein